MNKLRWLNTELSGRSISGSARFFIGLVVLVAVLYLVSGSALTKSGMALTKIDDEAGSCSKTGEAARKACGFEAQDSFWLAMGRCENLSDPAARARCRQEAEAALTEGAEKCDAQLDARLNLCKDLGEAPYDPKIDPANYVDPTEIGKTVAPNPYFPLIRGVTRIYKGGTQTITVTVTEQTRKILGVTCVVVLDVVEDKGEVIEDTKDWFAQDLRGNVWYFGESVKNLEEGELVSIDGSFTAGMNGDKAGVIMKAAPAVGEVYRQEFSLNNAEDAAEVLNLRGSATVPAAACRGDCLVTEDFTPLEPGAVAHKYYKPGVGAILEVNPETGRRVELVEIKRAPGAGSGIAINDVFPNSGRRGDDVILTVTGSGFTPQSRVSLSGAGARFFTQYISSAKLIASGEIADNAFTTTRDVVVSDPGAGSSTKVNAFWIKP